MVARLERRRSASRARSCRPARSSRPIDRQHEPDDADVAVVVERLAERRDHLERVEPGGESGRERRDGDDEQRVQPQDEADDDDQNARKDQHDLTPDSKRLYIAPSEPSIAKNRPGGSA